MSADSPATSPSGPGSARDLLDGLREHPEWDDERKAAEFDRLIGGFSASSLVEAVLPRLVDLRGGDGDILLQLVEGLANPELLEALADALLDQTDLSPDRMWMAFGVLEGTGRIEERPLLLELRDELEEIISGDDSLGELTAEIEDDPDSIAVAIEGLARIEPEVRVEIIAGLGHPAPGAGVLALLAELARSDDPITRSAAQEVLSGHEMSDKPPEMPSRSSTPSEMHLAARWPRFHHSAVGPMNSEGRARIVLLAEDNDGGFVADFECDVQTGIVRWGNQTFSELPKAEDFYANLTRSLEGTFVRDGHALALALLGGACWLSGDSASTETQQRLTRILGTDFRPVPIFADPGSTVPIQGFSSEPGEDARRVLEALPFWRDHSELARDLAMEISLREGDGPPDPVSDPGPFRILFENRILGRVEFYRRMLLWTALCWEAQGHRERAESAIRVAVQLSDPQHAVPGHPFLSTILSRSLTVDPQLSRPRLET